MQPFCRISATALALVLLAACETLTPANPYLGKWQAIYEGQVLTADIQDDGKCILSEDDKTWAGNWSIENNEIRIEAPSDTLTGYVDKQGKLVLYEVVGGNRTRDSYSFSRVK